MPNPYALLTTRITETALDAYSLGEQIVALGDLGEEVPVELLDRLQDRNDFMQSAVVELLENGQSDLLRDTLEGMLDRELADEGAYLEAVIEDATSRVRQADGTTMELKLIPLIVSEENGNNPLSGEVAAVIARNIQEGLGSPANLRVRVGRRLRDPSEVYDWNYQQVYEQTRYNRLDLRGLLTTGLNPTNPLMWEPALKFLTVHLTWLPTDELVIGQSITSEDVYTAIKENLKLVYGSPLTLNAMDTVFETRETAMAMYANAIAKLSIHRQLNATALTPSFLVMTCHAESEADEDDVVQVRLSLVEANGALVAGHIVELSDWLAPENVGKIVANICEWAGVTRVSEVSGNCEILDGGMPPFFYTGSEWAQLPADEHRVEQSMFG